MPEPNRLMLCAGDVRRSGWRTLDADPKKGGDFLALIPPLPADVKAIAWDEIEWIHGIAALYPWEAEEFLIEIREAMVPGGTLTIETPDFSKMSRSIDWMFGDKQFRSPLMMNKWSYTPDSLADALRKAGFREIRILEAGFHRIDRDFRVEALA